MTCAENYSFSIAQSTANRIFITVSENIVRDASGNITSKDPIDITASNIYASFKRKGQYGGDVLINLSTVNGRIVIEDGPAGRFSMLFWPSDTSSLAVFSLGYDVLIEIGGNPLETKRPMNGTLTVSRTYTVVP
jgi:hypothetical protein